MLTYVIVAAVILIGYVLFKNRGHKFTLEQVIADLDNGGLLIDVRSPSEYRSGHAKGAKNISLQSLQNGTMPSKDKQKAVYLYCQSGARSMSASSLLKRAGYVNVINIGSLSKWRKMGGKVVS